jgi:hypothetical protein
MSWRENVKTVLDRASKDSDFKEKLINDPDSAMRELGIDGGSIRSNSECDMSCQGETCGKLTCDDTCDNATCWNAKTY